MRISDWSSDVCSSDLIGNDLYRLFLDADMQYSCAYWPRPDMTLEEAQVAKKAHIAAKLALAPGQRVLDIGCGWGGMAITLAQLEAVEVLGITQIGRASGRERVCQYMWIQVVAGTLKKK